MTRIVTVLAVLILLAPSGVRALTLGRGCYAISDLGTLGVGSWAVDVNDLGQVVGSSRLNSGPGAIDRAFLWSGGVMRDLGTLGGDISTANAINNDGVVVGYSTGPGFTHAFRYADGVMQDLGAAGSTHSWASDINDAGQIVGRTSSNGVVVWEGTAGTFTVLADTLTWAESISSTGVIPAATEWWDSTWMTPMYESVCYYKAGSSWLRGGYWYPDYPWALFTYRSPLGTNARGDVVGFYGGTHGEGTSAYLHTETGVAKLAGLAAGSCSMAYDISDTGLIVGDSGGRAVLWQDGLVYDLNDLIEADPGWELRYAKAVNRHGQIVGSGLHNGQVRAFLLTPVPETSCLVALLGGCGFLSLQYRGRVIQRQR